MHVHVKREWELSLEDSHKQFFFFLLPPQQLKEGEG